MTRAENYVTLEFLSRSSNEGFARVAAAGFAAQLDPTLDELGDIISAQQYQQKDRGLPLYWAAGFCHEQRSTNKMYECGFGRRNVKLSG